MSNFEEVLDSILNVTLRFPLTMWRLVFRPRDAIDPSENCSPGAFLAIALLTAYVSLHALAVVAVGELPKWFDKETALVLAIAYVSLLVNIQRVVIGRIFSIRSKVNEKVKYLLYPASTLLILVSAITPFVYAIDDTLSWTYYAVGAFHMLYFWITIGVCRFAFELPLLRAFTAAVVAHLSFMLIPLALTAVAIFALG